MSDTSVTAEQVAAYLLDHPDFFAGHPGLLADLKIPHENGAAVSLVERQVGVLRDRNVELRERLNGLLAVARDNDIIFSRTRALVLGLVEAGDLAALAAALERSLREDFSMAAWAMVLVDDKVATLPARVRHVDSSAVDARVGDLVRGDRVVCGVLRAEELAFLFGDEGEAVGSAAIVPLAFGGRIGLLAIGARDPQHFRSGLDTLFVTHIGDVLARRLRAVLPAQDGAERARVGG